MTDDKLKTVKPSAPATSRTRTIAYVAMTIAIIAVSAWVTVPIGPVPFTLQMFAVTFALLILKPKQAISAIAGYLALGAIGVPVFSGMRGGIGVLMGPTGGFLWGYLIGVSVAVGVLSVGPLESFLVTVAPFIVVDLIKIIAATAVARIVMRTIPLR